MVCAITGSRRNKMEQVLNKLLMCSTLTLLVTISEFVFSYHTQLLCLEVLANQSLFHLLVLLSATASYIVSIERRIWHLSAMLKVHDSFNDTYIISQLSHQPWKRSSYGWARINLVGLLSSLIFLGCLCFQSLILVLQVS